MRIESELSRIVAAQPRRELDPERLIDISLAWGDALGRANTQRFIQGA